MTKEIPLYSHSRITLLYEDNIILYIYDNTCTPGAVLCIWQCTINNNASIDQRISNKEKSTWTSRYTIYAKVILIVLQCHLFVRHDKVTSMNKIIVILQNGFIKAMISLCRVILCQIPINFLFHQKQSLNNHKIININSSQPGLGVKNGK